MTENQTQKLADAGFTKAQIKAITKVLVPARDPHWTPPGKPGFVNPDEEGLPLGQYRDRQSGMVMCDLVYRTGFDPREEFWRTNAVLWHHANGAFIAFRSLPC